MSTMLRFSRSSVLLGLTLAMSQAIVVAGSQPSITGWYLTGNTKDSYLASLAASFAYDGFGSAYLASAEDVAGSNFGTLVQWIDARPFHGKRLKFSAYLMTADVTTGAALWMRIDGDDGQVLAFDNMSHRSSIRGDQAWSRHEVILDVPPNSMRIAYGVLLKGTGELWIDSVSIKTVFRHEAVTGLPVALPPLPIAPDELPAAPVNLDFESDF